MSRGTRILELGFWILVSIVQCAVPLAAQEQATDKPAREIFVPLEDLHVLLEGQTQRVFLSRKEYEELLAKARLTPAKILPLAAAILSADYNATAEEGRVRLQGKLEIEVLADGLVTLPLDLSGVGVRSAMLDGQPAAIGRGDGQRPLLFISGPGKKQLTLDLVAPLETSAAVQSLQFQVPVPATTRFRLSVPGNVEIKSGADVVSRAVDAAAGLTRFEVLLHRGANQLVMSLNNRRLLAERSVVARSVLIDEITSSQERLAATVSLGILHGAVDRFRFVLPEGFEATEVESPLLARWSVETVEGKRILDVVLREATTETVLLHLAAVRTRPGLEAWSFPQLTPLDVVSQVAVLGLLVEDRLQPQRIAAEGLLPINVADLAGALPPSLAARDAKAEIVRPVAAWYAPQAAYQLGGQFTRRPATLQVVTSLLLQLSDEELRVKGGITLVPAGERLFVVDFLAPPGWQVVEATGEKSGSGAPLGLKIETFSAGERGTRVQLRLPQAVGEGESYEVKFQAVNTAAGWLTAWTKRDVEVPAFTVSGVTRDVGAVSVRTLDDLVARPDKLAGLTPLDDADRGRFGLAGVETNLAFHYDAPYSAKLTLERTRPEVTARAFSFLRVSPEGLNADYELLYDVRRATTRRLSFRLPAETPGEITIHGLGETVVKETSNDVKDGERVWSVLLADKVKLVTDEFGNRAGAARLAVRFEQRLADQEPKDWKLPLIKADVVAYQSGLAAVEGSPELDIEIKTQAHKADVGDLAAAEHQPGRRLLGVFGYLGEQAEVKLDVFRHPGYGLPAAIVERAELVTLAAANGAAETAARYRLRSKALFLEVELPAKAKLWSARLDGRPLSPQMDGEKLLVGLPAAQADTVRDIQLVFETEVIPFGMKGRIETEAPRLYLRADAESERREVPSADLVWHLYIPSGYRVVRSDGTVYSHEIGKRKVPGESAVAALNWVRTSESRIANSLSSRPAMRVIDDSASMKKSDSQFVQNSGTYYLGPEMGKGKFEPVGDMLKTTPAKAPSSHDGEPMPVAKPESQAVANPDPHSTVTATPPAAIDPDQSPAAFTGSGAAPASGNDKIDQVMTPQGSAYWALEGVRSLPIDLAPGGTAYRFDSLGVEPRLAATVVEGRRFDYLAAGIGLLVGAIGISLTAKTWRVKLRYALGVLLAASLLPLLAGTWEELDNACDLAVCAGLFLLAYYPCAAAVSWLARNRRASAAPAPARVIVASIAAVLVAGKLLVGATAYAEPAEAEATPVAVPEDAVIVPYDPDAKEGYKSADKVLVPYEKYVELWNRAYPDKPRDAKPAPAPFALAGATYETRLAGDEFLLVLGRLEIEVLTDGIVEVPLPFSGGVLSEAKLDGKPARLRVATPAPLAAAQEPAASPKPAAPPPAAGESMVLLYASGQGRKQLNLAIRLPLSRQGGWRIAEGRLPGGSVAALTLTAPEKNTEIRLTGVADRRNYETAAAEQKIETALTADSPFRIEWRPKVAEAEIDRGLTVRSLGRLDVREDGLRLAWQAELEFPRGRREAFTAGVPEGYLVERVAGTNVRGWQLRDEGRRIEITLLKPAADRESFVLYLSRRGAVGQKEVTKLEAPFVALEGAALQQGTLAIRRSTALDVRTLATAGVSRTDNAEPVAAGVIEAQEASPLPLRAYESYRFSSVPFTVSLAATPVAVDVAADVNTLVRVAKEEATLAARIRLRTGEAPLHRLRVAIPKGLQVERLDAPGAPEWSVLEEGEQRVLTVYLPSGAQGEFVIGFEGSLGKRAAADPFPLPNVNVLDVSRQQGEIAVLSDPALNLAAQDLKNCESVLIERAFAWLTPPQKEQARLVLAYRSGDYSGTLQVSPRAARVTGYTISNVRVTGRTIEETILLEFDIQEGALRELAFQLPARLAGARVRAKNLRQATLTPLDQPQPCVRVWVELQDEVRGRFQVIVEHDRLRGEGSHEAPLTSEESQPIERRFVVLENASPDELLLDSSPGFEALDRRQRGWQQLAEVLGEGITSAYVSRDSAKARSLAFHLKQRAAVETASARIGLAETRLVLDGSGTYRAATVFRVNNRTEQFLEIELPAGAELWTARVAGAAVKPTAVPGAKGDRQVRVPLVKTEEGDDDYEVILKYGGRLPPLSVWSGVRFPLLKTGRINVEKSQVRLHLPESHAWFNFGGKMRYAQSEDDLTAGYLEYRNRQIEQLTQGLSSANSFVRLRSANNLKQIGTALQSQSYSVNRGYSENQALQKELAFNSKALEQANTRIAAQEQEQAADEGADNRVRLNWRQAQGVAQGESGKSSDLSKLTVSPDGAKLADGTSNTTFSREWLDQNKLAPRDGQQAQLWDQLSKQGKKPAAQKEGEGKPGEEQPSTLGLSTLETKNKPQQGDDSGKKSRISGEGGQKGATERYQRRLEEQTVQNAQPGRDSFLATGLDYAAPEDGRPPPMDADAPAHTAEATYLASLDVEFPQRGQIYRFTTPRGEVEITARPLAATILSRLWRAAAIAAVVIGVALAARVVKSRTGGKQAT